MLQSNFNEYMEDFKKLPLKEKQEIAIEQLKMLASFANQMCLEYEISNSLLLNKELLDINNDDYSDDDFVEAIIIYVNSIQNSLSDFTIGIADTYDKAEMLNDKREN